MPAPAPADADPDYISYNYDCENPDHPDYAGPWKGSDVVPPDASAPPTPDLATRYDHTVPTPSNSRPPTAASSQPASRPGTAGPSASRPGTAAAPLEPTLEEPPTTGSDRGGADVLVVDHADVAEPPQQSPRNSAPP